MLRQLQMSVTYQTIYVHVLFKILRGMARHAVIYRVGALLFSQRSFFVIVCNEVEFNSLAEMATLHSNQIK